MSIHNPENIGDPLVSTSDDCNSVVYQGSAVVGAVLGAADVVRPCRVAGGTKVHRVTIKNPDLDTGTTLVFKAGFRAMDGTAQDSGDDQIVVAAGAATWQAAAVTVYDIFPPFLVKRDGYLEIVVGTGGTANTGTVYAKVEGEGVGIA